MKKLALCLCLAAAVFTLPSCNNDGDELYLVVFEGSLEHPTMNDLQEFYDGGYNYIEGRVELDSMAGLQHLLYLSNVRHVTGDLVISNNPELETLEGLHRLQSVSGNFILSGNPALLQASYLGFIRSVGGSMVIEQNALLSLVEMPSLRKVTGNLVIDNNKLLIENFQLGALEEVAGSLQILNGTFTDMQAFSGLGKVGGGVLLEQSALRSLAGLEALFWVDDDLFIVSNKKLGDLCGITGLLVRNGTGGEVSISGNAYNPTVEAIVAGDCSQ